MKIFISWMLLYSHFGEFCVFGSALFGILYVEAMSRNSIYWIPSVSSNLLVLLFLPTLCSVYPHVATVFTWMLIMTFGNTIVRFGEWRYQGRRGWWSLPLICGISVHCYSNFVFSGCKEQCFHRVWSNREDNHTNGRLSSLWWGQQWFCDAEGMCHGPQEESYHNAQGMEV